MNMIDFTVLEVLDCKYEFSRYFVEVWATSYGIASKQTLMFKTREEASQVTVGYEFTA